MERAIETATKLLDAAEKLIAKEATAANLETVVELVTEAQNDLAAGQDLIRKLEDRVVEIEVKYQNHFSEVE